jgi:hypothetical protein
MKPTIEEVRTILKARRVDDHPECMPILLAALDVAEGAAMGCPWDLLEEADAVFRAAIAPSKPERA